MPQSKSVPTYINFAFDVPEPVSFSGNFVYNYFLKDERNSSNPWSDLSAVKRNTPRSDFNPLSPIPGIPARKNVLKFSSLNSITEIEESKNRYTEKQKLNFLNKNAEFILSEVEAQNERTVFISVQDKNSSKDIQSSLEAVLLHQRALERGLSPLEAVLKFNSITSDKISSQEILDTTDIEANSNLTYYDPVTKKDLSVQSLEGSLKTSLGGSYNKKFVADILKNAENSPFSPIWGNVESIISESEIIQNEASVGPPRVERPKKKRPTVFETPQKKGPGLFGDDDDEEQGPGLFGFDTPIKGGNKKQNLSNVYKNKIMKRPVRAEDGTYTVKGKKYKELFGSREQVHNGTAYKTKAGLTNDDILMNKWGRLVSAKKHETAKKEMRLEKHGYSAKKGKFGYVKKGKNTRKNKKEKKE